MIGWILGDLYFIFIPIWIIKNTYLCLSELPFVFSPRYKWEGLIMNRYKRTLAELFIWMFIFMLVQLALNDYISIYIFFFMLDPDKLDIKEFPLWTALTLAPIYSFCLCGSLPIVILELCYYKKKRRINEENRIRRRRHWNS